MKRKDPLVTGNVYHILNKSIAGYNIFPSDNDYELFIKMIRFFSVDEDLPKFSRLLPQAESERKSFEQFLDEKTNNNFLIQIIAYTVMPTHFHLVVKQLKDEGISKFSGNILGSYSRIFNARHKRRGPLWESRFKNVPVTTDEQLIHLTRYTHLNARTAGLVEKPEHWKYSSYKEYIEPEKISYPICKFDDLFDINPSEYRKFVEDQKDYQRELARIKKITLE
ncbi:MAG: transposase [Candidatus Pacebacteria bacterium]|nr:transposase [Candidatus Paceibacterota bacterium]